jgi:hypothetical protein
MNRVTHFGCIAVLTVVGTTTASPGFEDKLPRGIDFTLQNSPTAQKYLIETMPGGVALLDYNHDGLLDIFMVNGGRISTPPKSPDNFERHHPRYWNRLYRQNRDGSFTDVTEQAGLANAGDGNYGMAAAVGDYDNDGFQDLYVTSYGKNILHHNNGDGTFTDVSARSGFDKLIGRGLGVVTIDFNDDGWPDLFVARDASPNLLLINAKDGTFKDAALDAEVAYDASGNAKAGMGVDASDVNGDGVPDLVITNFNDQYHSLFFGSATFPYEEGTVASHLAQFSKADVGWGTKFLDYDNDGNLDLIMANGHINQSIESIRGDVKYLQPPLLLHNDGKAVFRNVRQEAGPAFNSSYVARGLAIGDFDNDGDSDVVITRLNATPLLLRNNVGQDSGWIGFELQGTKSNRDAIGAKIVVTIGNRRIVRWIVGGSSYLSSSDKRVLVGLGHTPKSSTVDAEIRWPSGALQNASNLEPNRSHKIVEGPGN